METKKAQYENRRMQLLEIGLDQFIAFGFFGTSTRKIAEIAGISSGLLFHYFPTKEALYLELIRLGCEAIGREPGEYDDPLAFFRGEADRIYDILERDAFSAKMFVFMDAAQFNAGRISSEAEDMLRRSNLISRGTDLIRKGQERGTIRQGDPLALTTAFYGALQSVAEWKAAVPSYPVPEKEWILDIIRAR